MEKIESTYNKYKEGYKLNGEDRVNNTIIKKGYKINGEDRVNIQ